METILELKGITKCFGSLVANDHIDFSLEKGTVHAIIGENGAGKSTLMNIISNIYQQDSGEIWLHGERVSFKDPMDACIHGIGMVYQEFMLCNAMTVLENIMLSKKRARDKIENICLTYHFNIPLDSRVCDLPVSTLQQVEIVKVLYRGAEILIFDEPTSILTPQGIEGLFDAIRFLKSSGKTVIFITHKLKEVLEISDKITVLKNGKVAGNVLPGEVDEKMLANMMVGRDVLLTAEKQPKQLGAPVLAVENLSARDASGVLRLKLACFNVHAGEIVGVAGVANSGQRELVETIFGLSEPENGAKIVFEGKNIGALSCRERRCLGIGYVPQDRLNEGGNYGAELWESAIMGYHVAHGFKHRALLDYKEIRRYSKKVIKDYAVKTPDEHAKVKTLSGGNVQKLIVGREFDQDNKLLIIVDPTRGIDIGAIEFIWKKIIAMAAEGAAILLVSHELNEVMELSDRILVMYDGNLCEAGKAGEATEEEIGLLMMKGKSDQ